MKTKLPERTTLDRLNKLQHDAYLYIDKHYSDEEPKKVERKVFKNKFSGQIGGPEILEVHHSLTGKL